MISLAKLKKHLIKKKRLKNRLLLSVPIIFALFAAIFLGSIWKNTAAAVPCTDQPSSLVADSKLVSTGQKKIIDVPYISQKGTLPTGCELISAAMVLNYFDYDVTVDQVVASTPQSDLMQCESGLVGAHPSKAFIGNPYREDGLGCYAPVIASVMNSFVEKDGKKQAVDVTGTDLEALTNHYINRDIPVLIWATINMQQPGSGGVWTIKETGKTFNWISGEHCLVLVGYDKNNYYFNDPYESNGRIAFEKELVNSRFCALGQQAVVVTDI
jgi:uncharacterized protein YvpB